MDGGICTCDPCVRFYAEHGIRPKVLRDPASLHRFNVAQRAARAADLRRRAAILDLPEIDYVRFQARSDQDDPASGSDPGWPIALHFARIIGEGRYANRLIEVVQLNGPTYFEQNWVVYLGFGRDGQMGCGVDWRVSAEKVLACWAAAERATKA